LRALKTIWGLLFRLFPCPTKVGLRRIGHPGPDSPVLVTCNFDLTVKRLKRILRGLDLWLLVAESKGVNVWCAAGAEEFNTHSVVSVVKTSGISERVSHRTLILPPLSAPGVKAAEVRKQTGWEVKWGPAYAEDIARYISNGFKRDEDMKRAKYDLRRRLDTAMGSLFPFYFLGAIGFLIFAPRLLIDYLVVGAGAFVVFMSLCPWIPGEKGIVKAGFSEAVLLAVLVAFELFFEFKANPLRVHLIIAMVIIPIYALELGGLASTMPSDLDAVLAKFGVGSIGNVAFAGTTRAELLNGYRELTYDRQTCKGCRSCEEVCPQGVWKIGEDKRAEMAQKIRCTACRACLVQCESGAIRALRTVASGA
jgi:NAD-dependent dihydropyrimidine dehydrogenase PreA subunit